MKLHRILAEGTLAVLHAVLVDRKVLDHTLANTFRKNPRWGKRDRSFVAESVFEIVRWRRALAFVADADDPASLCTAQWRRMRIPLPEWWKSAAAPEEESSSRENALSAQPRAVRESVPDWLDAAGLAELGDAWEPLLSAMNRRAPVFLRANTLRNSREEALAWLADHGIPAAAVPGLPAAIRLADGSTLPAPLLKEGRVEIQDAGSQMIAPLLGALPGESVVDACAGTGGKTLHLAALTGNRARITALDVAESKLSELEVRATRATARGIRTTTASAMNIAQLQTTADRLLIDAPCSGLGTLRRQPDIKWRLLPERLAELQSIRASLLSTLPGCLKPGGTMVYATCSILPSENSEQLRPLLAQGTMELVSEHHTAPSNSEADGFYAAVLIRVR